MFDLDHFVAYCRAARSEDEPRVAVRDLVRRAVSEPSAVGDVLRPVEGGLTLLARFQGHAADTELASRARAEGLAPSALSAHATTHPVGQGLLIGFTHVKPEQAADMAARLERAIGR